QKENMKSAEHASELTRRTMALTAGAGTNTLPAYMELLKAWRAMGGAQDYVVAQCHTITRKLFQEAGYGCVNDPRAVAVAHEIRARGRQALRNPDGYEIWGGYWDVKMRSIKQALTNPPLTPPTRGNGKLLLLPSWEGQRVGSGSQCALRKTSALFNRDSQPRMTKDKVRSNTETRRTNGRWHTRAPFDIRASDFFRHLAFAIRHSTTGS